MIGRLFPARASAGAAAFTLLVFDYFNPGTFASDAVVFWKGSPRPTRLVLPGACPGFCPAAVLVADITAEDLASPGTVVVTVINPAPGRRRRRSV
ncbi:MAG: hypothetical protein ABJC61_04645 [Acidobacteriota bacterium]